MKKLLSFMIIFSFGFTLFMPNVYGEENTKNIIIVYKEKIDETTVTNRNGDIKQVYDEVNIATGEVPVSAIPFIEKDKDVLDVEIDHRISIKGQQWSWGTEKINAQAAWNLDFTGQGVNVAVIDTGISPHEDLFITGGISFTNYTNSYFDDNGHGTHVAGIIGAKHNDIGVAGVAPGANIYAVKSLDASGSGYLSDIIAGIEWSIENKMDIINLSLGSSYDSLALKQAVDKAYENGILVVAAAGNKGSFADTGELVEYPAKYNSVIAVSAVDSYLNRGTFSAIGSEVEVAAPGVSIVSTYLNNSYISMSGTSMATPYVAGTLALLKEANQGLSPIQLRELLQKQSLDLGLAGRDPSFGFGLVQVPLLNAVPTIQNEVQTVQTNVDSVQKTKELVNTTVPAPVVQPVLPKEVKPIVKKPDTQKRKSVKKFLKATLTTDKKVYRAGNTVNITSRIVDKKTGKGMKGVTVKLTIKPPKGKVKTIYLKSDSRGLVKYKIPINRKTLKGYYKINSTTTMKGYNGSSLNKSIQLK